MEREIAESSNAAHSVGWFAAGALAVASLVALFLYADGYFSVADSSTQADEPRLIIEGQ